AAGVQQIRGAVGGVLTRLVGLIDAGEKFAGPRSERAAQLHRAARVLALPEGESPGLARCRADQHPVRRDLLDAPGGGAKGEGVADAGLVDHLLVQLADAPSATRACGGGDGTGAGRLQRLLTV